MVVFSLSLSCLFRVNRKQRVGLSRRTKREREKNNHYDYERVREREETIITREREEINFFFLILGKF